MESLGLHSKVFDGNKTISYHDLFNTTKYKEILVSIRNSKFHIVSNNDECQKKSLWLETP